MSPDNQKRMLQWEGRESVFTGFSRLVVQLHAEGRHEAAQVITMVMADVRDALMVEDVYAKRVEDVYAKRDGTVTVQNTSGENLPEGKAVTREQIREQGQREAFESISCSACGGLLFAIRPGSPLESFIKQNAQPQEQYITSAPRTEVMRPEWFTIQERHGRAVLGFNRGTLVWEVEMTPRELDSLFAMLGVSRV